MRRSPMLLTLVLAFGLGWALPVRAGEQDEPAIPARPALVVAIAVDQFSADLFAQYRRFFTKGLARLAEGAVFPSGYQSHAATETCPGHATILTGVHPARSGIIANWWFDPAIARPDKRVYCAEDETNPESSSDHPVVSARHLRVPTLGDRLKSANPASRNVAVSGKDRAAVMMGGHAIDAAYWWSGEGFRSFDGIKPGRAATEINLKINRMLAQGDPQLEVPAHCAMRDRPVAIGDTAVGSWRFPLAPGETRAFHASPRLDRATAALAVGLVDELQLGRDSIPDLLSISLSATDIIGHAFGHQGVEMCLQLAQVDETLGHLFAALDERGIDFLAVLTADHGGIDAPERLAEQAYPDATRIAPELQTAALARRIAEMTGIRAPDGPLLLGGVNGDLYVSAGLDPEERRKVISALVDYLKAHPQIAAVFTAEQLAGAPMPAGSPQDWTLLDRARASFDERISGDLVAVLKRGVLALQAARGVVATHGSIWDYDRRVPILFWRRRLPGFEQPAPVEVVDIAPTLAAVLDLEVATGEFDGRCLDIDGSARDTCAQ
ncbi:MAG: alkaline phosphatase family protein [Novosphingobium sp.]|nr:alkaline phosphatase family protein [Novosphingobium sp.]